MIPKIILRTLVEEENSSGSSLRPGSQKGEGSRENILRIPEREKELSVCLLFHTGVVNRPTVLQIKETSKQKLR